MEKNTGISIVIVVHYTGPLSCALELCSFALDCSACADIAQMQSEENTENTSSSTADTSQIESH